jgi:hypothetical protein
MKLLRCMILIACCTVPTWASTTAWRGLIIAVEKLADGQIEVTVRQEWTSWPSEGDTVTLKVKDTKSLTLDGRDATPAEALQVGYLIQYCSEYVECYSDPGYLPLEQEGFGPGNGVYHVILPQAVFLRGTTKVHRKGELIVTEKDSRCTIELHLDAVDGAIVRGMASVVGSRGDDFGYHLPAIEVVCDGLKVSGNRLHGSCTLTIESVTMLELDGGPTMDVPLAVDLTVTDGTVTGSWQRPGATDTDRKREPSAAHGRLEPHRRLPPNRRYWIRLGGGYQTSTWLFFREQGGVPAGDYFARYKPDPRGGAVTPVQVRLDDHGFTATITFVVGRDGEASETVEVTGVRIGDKLYGRYTLARDDAVFRRGLCQGQVMRLDAPIVVNPKRRDRLPATVHLGGPVAAGDATP